MIAALKPAFARLRGTSPKVPAGLFKNLLPLVVLAIGITALVLMFAWRDQANYKPVFGGREKVSVTDVVAALDAQGIPYRLHPDTGQVLVPESKLGRVRMLLASRGVVAKLPEGLELMDRNDPLGTSQFVQDVRFRRGLEGELSQSISSLEAVESARVHLSIARSTSFVVSDGEKSSASVVLMLKAGRTLAPEQIAAIINLVANSVASLDAKRVTVVDQTGAFLSSRVDLTDGYEGGQVSDASRHYQDETRRNIAELLAPVLGADNYKASVTADVDYDRVNETVERYGEAPKITNEAMRNESGRDPLAIGVPGSLSNRPVQVAAAQEGQSEATTAQKNATTRQYAYDRTITQTQRSRGRLKKLSVAVVLNGAAAPDHRAWSPAAIANVDKVLRSGLGIDETRGDTLVVSSMDFPGRPADVPWWQQRDNVIEMATWAAYALATLLAFLFIFRPVFRLAQNAVAPPVAKTREIVDLGDPAIEPGAAMPTSAAALSSADAPALGAPVAQGGMSVVPLLADYDLPPPGSPVDVMVEHLRTLAAKEPERVAEVVRQWVQKKERSEPGARA
ncbi:flagellar basal-body MS-ring/collar protein FliF [Uliginosibacterium sp. sgz301328]|uniref:flagellar basal-body MS-ring/collar protein FliF n=1 Tax=Uliginosibacterium sp. sgz301328 TaxID=3243764 RepID=UPI00359EA3AF